MLSIDIHWLVPSVILGSDRLLEYCCYGKEADFNENPLCNVLIQSLYDHQMYLSAPLRKEDALQAIQIWLDDGKLNVSFILNRICEYFLLWQGNCFEVKDGLIESWLSLCSRLDPIWVISFGYSQLLQTHTLSIEQFISLSEQQCPTALPKRFDGKEVADNHIHLNGHGHNSLSLLDFSLYLSKNPKTVKDDWPYRTECSLFNSGRLDITQLPVLTNQLFKQVAFQIMGVEQNEVDIKQVDRQLYNLEPYLLACLESITAETNSQRLLIKSHLKDSSEPSRWLLLATSILLELQVNKQSKVNALANNTLCYIQSCNLLRNYMIVSGVGLGRFVEYFGFKYRYPSSQPELTNLNYQSHTLSHDFSEKTYREFRGSPALLLKSKSKGRSTRIRLKPNALQQLAIQLKQKKLNHRSHFVIHFTRGFNHLARSGDYFLESYRYQLLSQVRLIQQFFASVHYSDFDISNHFESAIYGDNGADLRALIRGFDIAGNENELAVEFFSPALRVLRSGLHSCESIFTERLKNPFLTIHAGEDYSHLLSGMRAIDETVEFCAFRPGDRLGHALAIGVDVSAWAKKQKRAYLTVRQHLDNLVWCYGKSITLFERVPELTGTLSILLSKIHRWSTYIYGESICPNDLWRAWGFRQNCPLKFQSLDYSLEYKHWVPDFEILSNKLDPAVKLWQQYINGGTLSDPEGTLKENHVISINLQTIEQRKSVNCSELQEHCSGAELKLITAIQDLLIEKYTKQKIIFEVCPTSNIFIGRFEQYDEHPIYRWNPVEPKLLDNNATHNQFDLRTGPALVCVNTDDAGLMPTTIENEYRVLKETAVNSLNLGEQVAEAWINNIREFGVDVFKSNHLNW